MWLRREPGWSGWGQRPLIDYEQGAFPVGDAGFEPLSRSGDPNAGIIGDLIETTWRDGPNETRNSVARRVRHVETVLSASSIWNLAEPRHPAISSISWIPAPCHSEVVAVALTGGADPVLVP